MMSRPQRRVNGDGSLTRRADGRWMGRYYAWTSAGTRKRTTVYGKTRQEAADNLREAQERNRQGIPVPDRAWKLSDWLANVVAANRRPAPYSLYEMTVRLYLKPALGTAPLTRLSATRVQAFLNGQLAAGRSIRRVQIMRTVLSSALTRAMREELVMRNVAQLAELPGWERQPVTPWSSAEARAFLEAAKDDPLYPEFMLLLLYGLRRGEVLGLRWHDLDQEDGESASDSRSSVSMVNSESGQSRRLPPAVISRYSRWPATR
jgi:integrase